MEANRYISGKALGQVGDITFRLTVNSLYTLEAMNLSCKIEDAAQLTIICEEDRAIALKRLEELRKFVEDAIKWLGDNHIFDAAIKELDTGIARGAYRALLQPLAQEEKKPMTTFQQSLHDSLYGYKAPAKVTGVP